MKHLYEWHHGGILKTSKMSDRRRWKDLEIDALVDFVEVHYDYLTSAYNASKSKKDEEKWQECAKAIKQH